MSGKHNRKSKITFVELIEKPPVVLIIDCANVQNNPPEGTQMKVEKQVRFQSFCYDHAATVMYDHRTKHFWTVIHEEGRWYEVGRWLDQAELTPCEGVDYYPWTKGIDNPSLHFYVCRGKGST